MEAILAFQLEPSAPLGREVKRVVRERIDDALVRLDNLDPGNHHDVEDTVHAVRKRCKEVRALARLVRGPLGTDFDRFDDLVRRAAEELSSIRDAHAVLATFDELRVARPSDPVDDADLETIRATQAALAASATQGFHRADPRVERSRLLLTTARKRVRRWEIRGGRAIVAAGVQRTFEHGRRRLRRCRKQTTDERMHEWRKSVKTLWYQMRLLESAAPSVLTPLVAKLDDLAEALGDDHDLSVLVERLRSRPDEYGTGDAIEIAVTLAQDQQDDLRRRAFRLGATIYAERPDAFASRVAGYWRTAVREGPELPTGGIADLIDQEWHPSVASGAPARAGPAAQSVERERKFLVSTMPALPTDGTVMRQGYLAVDGVVSLRIRDAGSGGCTLTVKAGRGAVRTELEWPISIGQFDQLWPATSGRRISKTRYRLPLDSTNLFVELDLFAEDLDGLVVAEVEFGTDAQMEAFSPPEWFGAEVTDDPAYTNAALATSGRPTPVGTSRAD